MHTHLIILATAFIGSSFAAIDPLTVTSITPEQSSAIEKAESSLLASLTGDPAFSSLITGITADASALSVLTEFLAQPTPTGTEDEARYLSLISKLPSNVQGFISSFATAELGIASRILNSESGNSAAGSATSSPTGTTSPGGTTSPSTPTASSTAASSTAKQNVGALVESEGLGLVLAVLGMVIAVL